MPQLICDFLGQIKSQARRLLGQTAIIARKTSFKNAQQIRILNPQTAVFDIKRILLKINLNPALTGIFQTIWQHLLQNNNEPFSVCDDGSVQIMQIEAQALLYKENRILLDNLLDQIFNIFLFQDQILVETLQTKILQDDIDIGLNLKELLLQLVLDLLVLNLSDQQWTSCNGRLDLMGPERIVVHQVI